MTICNDWFVNILTMACFEGEKIPLDKNFFRCTAQGNIYILCSVEIFTTTDTGERKKQENNRNFFEKGIDFMGNLRYNWTVHEQKYATGGVTMPNIKSSKKDVLRSKIAYEKNKANKTALKTVLKKFDAALEAGDKTAAEAAYKLAVKAVDQGVNKGIMNKNAAARKKSSLTLKLNKLA